MAAMLFFFELVDQEKSKLSGGFQDKQVMSDLALLGRIEQYLRHGSTSTKDSPRNPKALVRYETLKVQFYSTIVFVSFTFCSVSKMLHLLLITGK